MRYRLLWLVPALSLVILRAQDPPAYTFGTTVVDSSGLQGRVFHLQPNAQKLPNFGRMQPVGSVYTNTLNVWPQSFAEGFPNVTERFEWFAIEYTGRFWIEKEGRYRFSLMSDDGSRLVVNNKVVIDNDGVHGATAVSASATLSRGVHEIKVEYFQGPRYTVALVLAIAGSGEAWRIFDMKEFKPPVDTALWVKGKISEIRRQTLP
jgi:hypothetical protein